MEQKITTTISQSKKLLELGIDPETSDMVWQSIENNDSYDGVWEIILKGNSLDIGYTDDIPAWSLSALLELMPGRYALDKLNGKYFITHNLGGNQYMYDTPLEAVYDTVVWLLENGFIEKGGKK